MMAKRFFDFGKRAKEKNCFCCLCRLYPWILNGYHCELNLKIVIPIGPEFPEMRNFDRNNKWRRRKELCERGVH